MVVWRPLPLEGKLDHMMPRASPGIVPYRAEPPGVQAHSAEPVHGTPFHSWTRSCASVADAPVLVWACPLIPHGVPIWPSVLLWKQCQDAGWGALVAPRPSAYSTDRPASVTPVTGHCCVSS